MRGILGNFFGQPVNFILSVTLIFLFGITVTSVVLDNQGLPNPLTELGGRLALFILAAIYGKAAFGSLVTAS